MQVSRIGSRLSHVSKLAFTNGITPNVTKRALSVLVNIHASKIHSCGAIASPPQSRCYNFQVKRFASGTISTQTTGVIQYNLADVGEGIAECEILKWHVKLGDKIKEFDPLCEVQSDKATVEITSRYDGVITKVHYKTGQMAKVGTPLVDIDLDGSGTGAGSSVVTADSGADVSVPIPQIGNVATKENEVSVIQKNEHVLTTPAVRHIAKQKGIDLSTVKGTGKDGRILKEDLLFFDKKEEATVVMPAKIAAITVKTTTPHHTPAITKPTTATTTTKSAPVVPHHAREEVVAITGIRRVMARTMTAAAVVPHFGFCDEYGMDQLQHIRTTLKSVAERRGIKLTYMPFFIKAASLALTQYPTLNSSINAELTELTIKHYHNIGVAMDTPHGLVVPNIKNVQEKSIMEIAQELTRLHNAALNNSLTHSELGGGTFTISNIGTIGGTYASPVLVLPEVVIGAIGKIQKVPRYDSKGNLIPVSLLQVSWSADHRVIDGATMANFSNVMKLYVEKPEAMIVDLR